MAELSFTFLFGLTQLWLFELILKHDSSVLFAECCLPVFSMKCRLEICLYINFVDCSFSQLKWVVGMDFYKERCWVELEQLLQLSSNAGIHKSNLHWQLLTLLR